jgi:hypothetical protein
MISFSITDSAGAPVPPIPMSPPPPLHPSEGPEEKPEKKRLSFVGRIKRSLSIGKGLLFLFQF